MGICPLTIIQYSDFVQSASVVVIHFRADWNTYDSEMRKRLEGIAPGLGTVARFGSFDTDIEIVGESEREEMISLCRQLGIVNLPALVFYRNGKQAKTLIGLRSKEQIEEIFHMNSGRRKDCLN